jgi:predicted MFS family arabinose efflux permease
MFRRFFQKIRHPGINHFFLFLPSLFFISLSENIISYIYPVYEQDILGSATSVGLIVAFSGVLAITYDFLFPQLLRHRTWRSIFLISIAMTFILTLFVELTARSSSLVMIIGTTIMWTTYYEMYSFGKDNFMIEEDKTHNFVFDWSLITILYQISAIIGPIIGSYIFKSPFYPLLAIQTIGFIGITVLVLTLPNKIRKENPENIKKKFMSGRIIRTFNFLKQLKYWDILLRSVLPLILLSLVLGLVDAMMWTYSGVVGRMMFPNNNQDWIVIIAYSGSILLGSLIMSNVKMKKYKKITSQVLLLAAGILLSLIIFTQYKVEAVILLIIGASFCLSIASILNSAVYSDLLVRMGKERDHLIGLEKVCYSISYLIGPLISGFMIDRFGLFFIFSFWGIIAVLLASILLLITPKTLRLKQQELKELK